METGYYLVTKSVADRCGDINNTYRIADGRFVETDRRLSRMKLTPSEYINGITGIEKVTEERAMTLIAANGYKKGVDANEEKPAAELLETVAQSGNADMNASAQNEEPAAETQRTKVEPVPQYVQEVIDGVRDPDDVPLDGENDNEDENEEEEMEQVEAPVEESETVEGKTEEEEQVEAPEEEEEMVEIIDKKKK